MIMLTRHDGDEEIWVSNIVTLRKPFPYEPQGTTCVVLVTGNTIIVRESMQEILVKLRHDPDQHHD